ncbi:TIGR04219 family outer membrane beta-barrel protein [Gallaecimonas mangrovi]|uniref:TIGR04219 family outer membrane beta-barrel protein n=1 Tax=Gallaecimonas mangrovi TaxID=2291597 RepID=UPI001867551C|nr:TIGR04219 family outer membrane beta-barrel protein [Gallaecimonas mangrovi]
MKKTLLLASLASAVVVLPAHADFLGIYAGAGYWKNDMSGDLLGTSTSADNELGLDSADLVQWYVNFEHPIPLIPNVRIAYSDIDQAGSGTLDSGITYDGNTYSGQVDSHLALKMTDVTLYYELWDTGADFDVGVTGRKFDGYMQLSDPGGSNQASSSVNDWVPMAYGNLRIDLPFTGLYAQVQGNGIAYSGNHIYDYSALIGYTLDIPGPFDVGVEAGYRRLELKLSDIGDFNTDLDISGPFVNVTMHF